MSEEGGEEVRSWLEGILLNEMVDVVINPRIRVGKWGRILGTIIHRGVNINEESIRTGRATTFTARGEGKIPNINEILNVKKWF